ncbi:PE-PPE domain-containing protein [Mycolicibacterium vaccae]|uniref:PE-PPE domain-containing protein n=1 Tax=Mycolicibacterium vaccae TaxID=1810 RepID=UPI003CED90C0
MFANSAALVGAVTGCLATASIAVAATTTVVTVAGNTNVVSTPMSQELRGSLCQAPAYRCERLPYRSGALGAVPLDEGAVLLQRRLANSEGPTIVLAYSQGGIVATTWLNRYGTTYDEEQRGNIVLVLLGSPQNGMGGFGPALGSKSRPATPTDTGFAIIEVTRQYDLESDYPTNKWNLLATANAFAGFFGVHTDYTGVDLLDPNNLIKQVGGTTYVLVPTEHLPLLNPLRRLGLTTLANSIEARWKPIIDAGYDRTGYVTLADAWRDGLVLPEVLAAGAPDPAPQREMGMRTSRTFTLDVAPLSADIQNVDGAGASVDSRERNDYGIGNSPQDAREGSEDTLQLDDLEDGIDDTLANDDISAGLAESAAEESGSEESGSEESGSEGEDTGASTDNGGSQGPSPQDERSDDTTSSDTGAESE